MINSKQHGVQNSGPWDAGKHQTKKKSLVYEHGGGRVQNSRPWDPWLPMVENSRLFAQRGHSTCQAHGAPPMEEREGGYPESMYISSTSYHWLHIGF